MVKGFTKDDKFHPIKQYQKKGVRKSRQRLRYANDIGSATVTESDIKSFARKIKDRYDRHQAKKEAEFLEDVAFRRKFESRLITSFRLGKAQGINNPIQMEKFIRGQIPELPKDKATNKFVNKVLKDFKERLAKLTEAQKGKPDEVKEQLKKEFEESLEESETLYRKVQAQQDTEFAKKAQKAEDELRAKAKKSEEQAKKAEEKARQAEKDAEEARKKAQSEASEKAKQEAEQKAKESEKQAEQAEQKSEDIAQEVKEDLKQETKEATEEIETGFPSGII